MEAFIQERNQEREVCINGHMEQMMQKTEEERTRWSESMKKMRHSRFPPMTAVQLAWFDEKGWTVPLILDLIPEMKYQGSVLPAVFGYSLTEAGLTELFKTLEKWIIEQRVLQTGFLQLGS